MKFLVLIKHVPETENLRLDEEKGTVVREGVESIINPLDLYALEAALSLREVQGNGEVIALSMGPKGALGSLKEAVAMGCDDAYLLTGSNFSGSDTLATSYSLSEAIKHLGYFDLVLCGERAIDGETGQVGPGVASFLDLPIVTFVNRILFEKNSLIIERMIETGIEVLKVQIPAVISVIKAIGIPRLPTLHGKKRAKNFPIKQVGIEDIRMDREMIGLSGSPTRVIKVQRVQLKRDPLIIHPKTDRELDEALDRMIEFLEREGFINNL